MLLPIEGYDNYAVSDEGFVINTKTGRVLKVDVTNCGYARVTVSKDNVQQRFSLHRLVAHHFIQPVEGKELVNHKDGNKLNNNVANLEWCTYSENFIHAQDMGLRAIGSSRASAKLDEVAASSVCKMIQDGVTRGEILSSGIHPDLKRHMVDNIRRRRTWKHVSKDYVW